MFLNIIASAFASVGMLFGALFGGHVSPGPNQPPPQPYGSSNSTSSPFANFGGFLEELFGMHASSTPPFGSGHMGSTTPWQGRTGSSTPMGMKNPPAVVGVVTGVNGTTLTVSGFAPMVMTPGMHMGSSTKPMIMPSMHMASTTYTVDASGATVTGKGNASESVSSIQVNDQVVVFGTVSGTSVTATSIIDSLMSAMGIGHGPQGGNGHWTGSSTGSGAPPWSGNGQ